jgi:dTDP-glucose 4,6-dehydratase
MKRFVTGGAGYIGSLFIRDWVKRFPQDQITDFDNLKLCWQPSQSGFCRKPYVHGDVRHSDAVLEAIP